MGKDITEDIVLKVPDGTCGDGCGEKPASAKGKFRMGHDARLKSLLHRAHRGGAKVTINGKSGTAASFLQSFGWPLPAPKSARKPMSDETKAKLRASKAAASPKGSTKKASRVQPKARPKGRTKVGASA